MGRSLKGRRDEGTRGGKLRAGQGAGRDEILGRKKKDLGPTSVKLCFDSAQRREHIITGTLFLTFTNCLHDLACALIPLTLINNHKCLQKLLFYTVLHLV